MKTLHTDSTSTHRSIISAVFASVFVSVLSISGISMADARLDATTAITELRMTNLASKMPDEMKSLEAIFALAEQQFQANDTTNSEQHYKLTIQKARLLTVGAADQKASPPSKPQVSSAQPESSQIESPPAIEKPAHPGEDAISAVTAADTEQEHQSDTKEIVSDKLVGTIGTYLINKGDTLRLVAAKLGVSRQHLAQMNKLDSKASLQVGQQLKYNNRKIIPLRMKEGIVVNIPDRTLYYFQQGKLVRSLPVALGTSTKNEKYDWQTPVGKFKITAKQKDPTWYVPPSIQAEMEEAGKEVITSVPPGPDNPLGKYAIKTSIPGILIHSTIKPWSIYSFASHGCIRVYPPLMEEFFKEVKVNTPGEIIYHPVKLAVTEEGRVYLEVHNDIYSKSSGLAAEARKLVEKNQLSDRIDWKKFESVVKQKLGIAEDITM